MQSKIANFLLGFLMLFVACWASADDDAEVTMTIMDDADAMSTEEVMKVIELPSNASAEALARSEFGLATANSARESGREFGEQTAADARPADLPERPETSVVPERPETPVVPERPERPETPVMPEIPERPDLPDAANR